MDTDPSTTITESAKAIQELAKTTGKIVDASNQAGGWFDGIFGQGLKDTVGLWSDRQKTRRIMAAIYDAEKLLGLNSKVTARLAAKGISILRMVPPKIALGIIEHATIEDDNDLHSLWANLLVTGLDAAADEIHTKYISVLADLTHADAVVLDLLCEEWFNAEKPPKADRYGSITYGPSVDGLSRHNAVSIITLNRLGLISPGYIDFISYAPNEERSFKDLSPFHGSDVTAYGNLDVVEVTAFGVAFYRAVITG